MKKPQIGDLIIFPHHDKPAVGMIETIQRVGPTVLDLYGVRWFENDSLISYGYTFVKEFAVPYGRAWIKKNG